MNQGQKTIPYFSCKKFVEMSPLDRFKELRSKGFCYMCLYPGALNNSGKHRNGSCQNDFTCKHTSHNPYTNKNHVLVCHEHHSDDENVNTLEQYKSKCILRRANSRIQTETTFGSVALRARSSHEGRQSEHDSLPSFFLMPPAVAFRWKVD